MKDMHNEEEGAVPVVVAVRRAETLLLLQVLDEHRLPLRQSLPTAGHHNLVFANVFVHFGGRKLPDGLDVFFIEMVAGDDEITLDFVVAEAAHAWQNWAI